MENDKKYEVGHFFEFHFKCFLLDEFKLKPNCSLKQETSFIMLHLP
jgi:hypothetical protein